MVKSKIKQTETETRNDSYIQKKQKLNQINQKGREQPTKQKNPKRKSKD